jgi:hypothetical protein
MKKMLSLSLLLLFSYALHAQDLSSKVPSNAAVVAKINSNNFFKYLSAPEFDQSYVGKTLMENVFNTPDFKLTSIQESGLKLSSSVYFFYAPTDSISYTGVLLPLQNAVNFDQLMKKYPNITHNGDTRKVKVGEGSTLVTWNNEMALITDGSIKDEFFMDSLTAKRFGMEVLRYQPPVLVDDIDSMVMDSTTVDVVTADTVATTDMDDEVEETDSVYEAYSKKVAEQNVIKNKIQTDWIASYATLIFAGTLPSITTNSSYTSSADEKALASVWISSLSNLYAGILPASLPYGRMLQGYENMNLNLFADERSFKINTALVVEKQQAERLKKIYQHRLNKKFLKYVNSEKAIAMIGYSMDTQSYLEELPNLIMRPYSAILGFHADEAAFGTDLLSLLLDEKAVAKVFKGDALFLMNGLTSKQVTYKTYEYDEDYKRTEIEKTKTETLPSFLSMISTDEPAFFEKLLAIGIKREVVTKEQELYMIEGSKDLFNIYFLIKDKILFCGTSKVDLQNISNNQFEAKISKQQKALLTKNNFLAYFSGKNLAGKIPKEEFNDVEGLLALNKTLGTMGDVHLKSSGIVGNEIRAELVAEIPNAQQNALKYLFSLIENIAKK